MAGCEKGRAVELFGGTLEAYPSQIEARGWHWPSQRPSPPRERLAMSAPIPTA